MTDLLIVVGARPNFMKAASVVEGVRGAGLTCTIVHTGQHYDDELSSVFFRELRLPPPDVQLGVGSGSHAVQTARIMTAFEPELRRVDPALVVVVGDVNSTLACALVAVKERYPVVHVEAGLRCFDPWMAEEINRKVCDHLSSILFTTSRDAGENLLREGCPPERIAFVGNTMIDTLLRFADVARQRRVARSFGLEERGFAVLTLHRPENVDRPGTLSALMSGIELLAGRIPVVFPVHPRTRARLADLRARARTGPSGLLLCEPLGYLDFVSLLGDARLVLTDSGGVQEETTVLGVPCLTLRESTERPVTVAQGTNRVVGTNPRRIVEAALPLLAGSAKPASVPDLWDGLAGTRIAARLGDALAAGEGRARTA